MKKKSCFVSSSISSSSFFINPSPLFTLCAFNGEIGTIIEIDEREKVVKIQFDDEKVAWYEYSDLDQIEHSYAITIHKAQR